MARMKRIPIDPNIKRRLGFDPAAPDAEVLKAWKAASSRVCKPCWELRYCPYGPLVENFPLLPPLRAGAIAHNEYLKDCLITGKFGEGKTLDNERRKLFEGMVISFRESEYPEALPLEIEEMKCRIFGHICPVVFCAETSTETTEARRTTRHVSPRTLMRVARRDNYHCQRCNAHLADHEIEFDHKIPYAKGGSSDEHNIEVTCFKCNRRKSDRVEL